MNKIRSKATNCSFDYMFESNLPTIHNFKSFQPLTYFSFFRIGMDAAPIPLWSHHHVSPCFKMIYSGRCATLIFCYMSFFACQNYFSLIRPEHIFQTFFSTLFLSNCKQDHFVSTMAFVLSSLHKP